MMGMLMDSRTTGKRLLQGAGMIQMLMGYRGRRTSLLGVGVMQMTSVMQGIGVGMLDRLIQMTSVMQGIGVGMLDRLMQMTSVMQGIHMLICHRVMARRNLLEVSVT